LSWQLQKNGKEGIIIIIIITIIIIYLFKLKMGFYPVAVVQ
jgi:hypothetical protein